MDNNEKKSVCNHYKINFNLDGSCFSVISDKGFRIFHTDELKMCVERQIEGGLSILEILNNTNIMVFVGSGSNPQFPLNQLIIWDDYQMKIISEIKVSSNIRNLKINKDNKIYMLKLANWQLIESFETCDNPKGIIAISSNEKYTLFSYPEKTRGHVIIRCQEKSISVSIFPHESKIAFLALNNSGSLLATASDKGTLIRIFNTLTGDFLNELRRGKDKAEIYSICFNYTSNLLACCSERKTVHIFSLIETEKNINEGVDKKFEDMLISRTSTTQIPKNSKSVLSVFKFLPKYFSSQWSFANCKLSKGKRICIFSKDSNKLIAVSEEGKVVEISFDSKKGGDCKIENEKSLDNN